MSDLFTTTLSAFTRYDGHCCPGVYAFVTDELEPLYIGHTNNLTRRLQEHLRTKAALRKARKLVFPLKSLDDRLTLEAVLILRYRPPLNKAILLALNGSGKLYEPAVRPTGRRRK